MTKNKRYWLFKSEQSCYSILDLKKDKITAWTDVRNFQARNFIRDDMSRGDMVLFYHSNSKPNAIVGVAKIVGDAYPDPTAFDRKNEYFDPKSNKDSPTWYSVDLAFVKNFKQIMTLEQVKFEPKLKGMVLAQKGSRLSIQPVSEAHFKWIINKLG